MLRLVERALEAIKEICKEYRYMVRPDDLYREMNGGNMQTSPKMMAQRQMMNQQPKPQQPSWALQVK